MDDKILEKIPGIVKKYGPEIGLLEKHLFALKYAHGLQKFDKNYIFFGGTAAQFYLPTNFQRTSVDVDLITNKSYEDTEEIVKKYCAENGIEYDEENNSQMKNVSYGKIYKFKAPFKYSKSGYPDFVRIEIVSKISEKLNFEKKANCQLYGEVIGDFILLSKVDLFAKKLATLDLGNIGLKVEDGTKAEQVTYLSTKIGKHVYDIKRLYDVFGKEDFEVLGEKIYEQFDNDIKSQNLSNCTAESCIENVCKNLGLLGSTGLQKNPTESLLFKKARRNIKVFLPKGATFDNACFGAIGWEIEHLLKATQKDHVNSDNKEVLQHYTKRESLNAVNKENTETKALIVKEFRDRKISTGYKAMPLPALVFKHEMLTKYESG